MGNVKFTPRGRQVIQNLKTQAWKMLSVQKTSCNERDFSEKTTPNPSFEALKMEKTGRLKEGVCVNKTFGHLCAGHRFSRVELDPRAVLAKTLGTEAK